MAEGSMVISVATGAMNSLLCKLGTLLEKEYTRSTKVRRKIIFLKNELSGMDAMLRKYSVLEQSDPQVRAWMKEVRELSYDIEDCIDSFVHRVDGHDDDGDTAHQGIYGFFRNTIIPKLKRFGARREITSRIDELEGLVVEASERRARYNLSDAVVMPPMEGIDPRLPALYVEMERLVGLDGPRDELVRWLTEGEIGSMPERKVVSIVGFAGCGKTTLANQVFKKAEILFDCKAFVSVSQNPDMNKILADIHSSVAVGCTKSLDDHQKHIDCIRHHLQNKRYLIIVDDVWSSPAWNIIQCAFPENNNASRIMTTTRNASVANSCCSSHQDLVYEVKPLSRDDSKILFLRRIFGSSDRCLTELEIVSDQILKKCGGLPLAIISIASMLASKPLTREQWERTLESIGHALENDLELEHVKKILLLSYHDLPDHLKTCLLYLSVFPEDYRIDRDRLVWRWIAEGFISEGRGKSLEEIGEGYFNELINRSMIIHVPAGSGHDYQVHDVMLDLLVSLSNQDNFLTVFGAQCSLQSLPSKVRRLSLQGDHMVRLSSAHVRSLSCFRCSTCIPSVAGFNVLRVLDLQGCTVLNSHLQYIGSLIQLRYLGLRSTKISILPEQIGNLKILQTIDLRETRVTQVPQTIVRMQQLVRLLIDYLERFPDGIGNMKALQKLPPIKISKCSTSFLKELGKMSQLREVNISNWDLKLIAHDDEEAYLEAFVSSLCELGKQNLRRLSIISTTTTGLPTRFSLDFLLNSWCPPPRLLEEFMIEGGVFSSFPKWLLPLANLSTLTIGVKEIRQEDLCLLGDLPSLNFLHMTTQTAPKEKFSIGRSKFQSLEHLFFYCLLCGVGLNFEAGAMPKLKILVLQFSPQETFSLNGGFHFGIENFSCLELVQARIYGSGTSTGMVERFTTAIKGAAKPSTEVSVVTIGIGWNKVRRICMALGWLRALQRYSNTIQAAQA